MNNKDYLKKFARYSLLSILGTLGVSCYILADTFYIAMGVGTNGLAALNIALPAYNFMIGIGLMLGMGGATKFSIEKSKGDKRITDVIFTNTVYLALIFGLILALIGAFFSEPMAVFFGADAEILDMTVTYMKWQFLFAPAFILSDVLLCFVRNDNGPLLSTVAVLVGSFANIILDYVFIFPMKMGMFGAVFASGLSPVISILIIALHWIRKKNGISMVKTRLYFKIIGTDFALGFPSFIAQVASGVAMMIFNLLILELEGNVGVAAYGIIANIALVVLAIYTGLAQGVQPLISTAYGKGDKKAVGKGLQYSMTVMAVLSCVMYLILFVFAGEITGIFNSEGNLRLQEIAESGMKLYFMAILFAGFNTILATYFTSVEKVLASHILSLLRGVLLLAPLAYLLAKLWQMTGIWLTYPVTEGLVAVLGYAVYRHGKHAKRQ